ncbi:DNA-binding transcriptional regulator [Fructobacillus cardui]|jgi:uncharacterized protein YxeA|uniref:XRE-family HTH domain (XRE) n=1 Tax=Fructobacillus cardui TaxID=2893170 RepID=A0ABM9MY22_9LACO|nr:DNA-binding transcriptional regulator [Fructobacillus cardui]CAK1249251.1 DNA-binding transcriptional regulator [Fructobacillus cardui]
MTKDNRTLAQKVDQDLVKKSRYKKLVVVLGSLIALVVIWVSTLIIGYTNGVSVIDRFNPFLSYTTAYTKLPSDSLTNPNNNM